MGTKCSEIRNESITNADKSQGTNNISTELVSSRKDKKQLSAEEIDEFNKKISNYNKILTSLFAGALAGAVAKTVIAPLDRTKINFQISSDKRYSFRGAVRFLVRSVKNDGFFHLWRGNTATMARIMPFAAVQYASHEQWKFVLNPSNPKTLPPLKRYVAGSLAGVTASTITYPLDLARARMAVTRSCMYSSLVHVFIKIYKKEGLLTMYKGYIPTVLGVIPYAGTSFFTYETLKQTYQDKYLNPQEDLGPMERLLFGAVAGLFGQTSSYPLDIVRRRMQTAGVTGKQAEYRSVWSTLKYVYRTEGVKNGLYKGLSMNWLKGPIAVGVSFSTFETVQEYLMKHPFFQDMSTLEQEL